MAMGYFVYPVIGCSMNVQSCWYCSWVCLNVDHDGVVMLAPVDSMMSLSRLSLVGTGSSLTVPGEKLVALELRLR